MGEKGPTGVLNRNEIIEPWMGEERVRHFKMEPDYLGVILVALVYAGEIEVVLPGRRVDAATLEEIVQKMPLGDFLNFRYLARPRELPLSALMAVMELLGASPGLMQNPDTRDTAVVELQRRVNEELERVVKLQNRVRGRGSPGRAADPGRGDLAKTPGRPERVQKFPGVPAAVQYPRATAQFSLHP